MLSHSVNVNAECENVRTLADEAEDMGQDLQDLEAYLNQWNTKRNRKTPGQWRTMLMNRRMYNDAMAFSGCYR